MQTARRTAAVRQNLSKKSAYLPRRCMRTLKKAAHLSKYSIFLAKLQEELSIRIARQNEHQFNFRSGAALALAAALFVV
jgi:hypothetical protein